MPSIRGSLSNGQPLIEVLIGSALEPTRWHACIGLIDTGCTITGIAGRVVATLGLQHATRKLVVTPLGEARRKAYPFSVGFLDDGDGTIGATRRPFYFPDPVLGADFVENSNFDVLLGMDILARGRLLFEHGRFEFSF